MLWLVFELPMVVLRTIMLAVRLLLEDNWNPDNMATRPEKFCENT